MTVNVIESWQICVIECHHRGKGESRATQETIQSRRGSFILSFRRLFLCPDLYATVAQWMGERSQLCWTVARFDSGPWHHTGSSRPGAFVSCQKIYRLPRKKLTAGTGSSAILVGDIAMQAAHLGELKKRSLCHIRLCQCKLQGGNNRVICALPN